MPAGPFYVAPNLEGSRYLYLPAAGYALAMAAAVSIASRHGFKYACYAAMLCLLGM